LLENVGALVRVEIATGLADQIRAAAAATPGMEVCGLLFGTEARIEHVIPAANVAPEPDRAFEINPAALFAALRAERAGGARLIGHYHSHPNGRAEPSARDLAAAEEGRLWLIVAGDVIRAWIPVDGGFREVALLPDANQLLP
jgi:proteasome lid subunit RPN8/RPN11